MDRLGADVEEDSLDSSWVEAMRDCEEVDVVNVC